MQGSNRSARWLGGFFFGPRKPRVLAGLPHSALTPHAQSSDVDALVVAAEADQLRVDCAGDGAIHGAVGAHELSQSLYVRG